MSELYDVQSSLNTLAAALAEWEGRDDTRPQPEVREAANAAMGAIDGMLRELHLIRGRLQGEIRASDDATDKRARDLLEAIRRGKT